MPLDFTQFLRGIREGHKQTIDRGMFAMNQFTTSVIGLAAERAPVGGPPYSPRDPAPGTLKDSAYQEPAILNGNTISCKCGFNTVYAQRQHYELSWRHSQGQALYFESALREKTPLMMQFIGSVIG